MSTNTFHVISNTHWDREWRFPFQRNRQMLVDMIDAVLAILEHEPSYRAFHLDSQSIVVKDYLEIRPQNKDRFIRLVKENRLLIGPWYILPEEFQVGGENLIRNLLLGHKVCAEHGGVSKIGYSPFSWGQISQLPQLYKEFGINLIMFYRGVNSLDSPKAEFLWEGADGTRSLASRFSTMPRYNFYFYIYRPVVHNEAFADVEYKWSRGGTPFHFADKEQSDEDFFLIAPLDTYFPENIKPHVDAIIKDQQCDFTTEHAIWMEGHDSSGPNVKTVRIIRDIQKMMPHIKVVHSTLEEYAKALAAAADENTLTLVNGERRSAQFDRRSGNMFGYTTSARMFLKQKNFSAERWVQFYAEPFNVFSGLCGRDINDRYLETAWELLIQNSAHDSIGGCSLDEVHDDMMFRYKHAIEIAKGVFDRSLKHLVAQIDMTGFPRAKPSDDLFLTVFNPNNGRRNEIVEAFLDIPKEFDKGSLTLSPLNGHPAAMQLIESVDRQPVLEQMIDRPLYFSMRRYRVYFHVADVPPFGFTTLKITPATGRKNHAKKIARMKNSLPILENDALKVSVEPNGTFSVLDKRRKRLYRHQGSFFDEGEAGHAWVHESLAPFISTRRSKPRISIVENGPLSATCRISHTLRLPSTLKDRKDKSGRKSPVAVNLFLTLTALSNRVDLKVTVNNQAESHRLRMMFPTGLEATDSYGEGQFDVVKRTLDRPDTKEWIEQPMYDFPMHHFVDVTDGSRGTAILVNGLKEYEVLNDADRTIAITLLRGFEFIVAPSSRQDYSHEKGSQCPGLSTYDLAFFPHDGDWNDGKVYEEALNFNNALRIVQTGRTPGSLSPSASFMEIQPRGIIFSALKRSEDGKTNSFVLRIYNPTETQLAGNVRFQFAIAHASVVTIEEKYVLAITLNDQHSFNVTIGSKKIQTIQIDFY
ncbi:MAG: glycosyl hydrolase-related protein [Ignavibacteriales bacterium]|nr:glycosyl hydrolase-related protein [Ignavibacteriales bacterium]